ncbi:MAG: peptidoglycan DD-metalloendopeptidase family protein [Candidatus Spechtbacteria bacterium]|nr:peptidoglycan DD-metalloendopeptidase family protein [Candidatus Spechtbacteria bacterium]
MRSICLLLQLLLVLSGFANYASATTADDIQKQLDEKQQQIRELQEQAQSYKENIDTTQQQANTLKNLIANYNRSIQSLEKQINKDRQAITLLSDKITQTELQIHALERSIERNKEQTAALVREIYASDSESILELVLKYENLSNFYDQVQNQDSLNSNLYENLKNLKSEKAGLENAKLELNQRQDDLNNAKDDLTAQQAIVESQRADQQDVLKQTRNQEAQYQNLLKDVTSKQDEVQRQIFELEDRLRETLDPSIIPTTGHGVLEWPASGRLSQGYGCTAFAKKSKAYPTCFHNGIDIAGPIGTPLRAAREGVVIGVASAPYAYGKWITIEHDNGLVTLYGHMSVQTAKVGQTVKRGDIIGYMGSTGYSTGSHVHFTVYAPNTYTTKASKLAGTLPIGASLNPMDYLPK